MNASKKVRVRVRGELACFTRPEMKVERVSYEVMTPSAARGILEAVLWKPAIAWQVHAIEVRAPIRWTSFRRNEVNGVASVDKHRYCADEDRTQRNTVALRNVDYVIQASFVLTSRAGADDTIRKFEEMFARRVERGQNYHAPSLGCREFAALVEPAVEPLPLIIDQDVDRPLGWMFYDYDWSAFSSGNHRESDPRTPLFFAARLESGVLRIPDRATVRARSPEASP